MPGRQGTAPAAGGLALPAEWGAGWRRLRAPARLREPAQGHGQAAGEVPTEPGERPVLSMSVDMT